MPNSLLGFISHQETKLEGKRRNVLNGKVFKQQSESFATKRSFFTGIRLKQLQEQRCHSHHCMRCFSAGGCIATSSAPLYVMFQCWRVHSDIICTIVCDVLMLAGA